MIAPALLLPERLPSVLLLVGFWIPPALGGWALAWLLERGERQYGCAATVALLASIAVGCAIAWFLFNLGRMPPYIPGAGADPTIAPPRTVAGLATFSAAIILPGSAVACFLAFRYKRSLSSSR
jgi:hypothetical protein